MFHTSQNHNWFHGVDWDHIRDSTAPYFPEVSSPTDTSNFDVDDIDIRLSDALPPVPASTAFSALHLPFVGFSFTQGRSASYFFPLLLFDTYKLITKCCVLHENVAEFPI